MGRTCLICKKAYNGSSRSSLKAQDMQAHCEDLIWGLKEWKTSPKATKTTTRKGARLIQGLPPPHFSVVPLTSSQHHSVLRLLPLSLFRSSELPSAVPTSTHTYAHDNTASTHSTAHASAHSTAHASTHNTTQHTACSTHTTARAHITTQHNMQHNATHFVAISAQCNYVIILPLAPVPVTETSENERACYCLRCARPRGSKCPFGEIREGFTMLGGFAPNQDHPPSF